MTKEQLNYKIKQVSMMSKDELEAFARTISLSEASDNVKRLLNKAIDLRFIELGKVSALCVEAMITDFEYLDLY